MDVVLGLKSCNSQLSERATYIDVRWCSGSTPLIPYLSFICSTVVLFQYRGVEVPSLIVICGAILLLFNCQIFQNAWLFESIFDEFIS